MIEDCFTVNSPEFLQFAREFREEMLSMCDSLDAKLERFNIGHYAVSGFVVRNGATAYFSYSIVRGCEVQLRGVVSVSSVLVRRVTSTGNYHGGYNNFVPMDKLQEHLDNLL